MLPLRCRTPRRQSSRATSAIDPSAVPPGRHRAGPRHLGRCRRDRTGGGPGSSGSPYPDTYREPVRRCTRRATAAADRHGGLTGRQGPRGRLGDDPPPPPRAPRSVHRRRRRVRYQAAPAPPAPRRDGLAARRSAAQRDLRRRGWAAQGSGRRARHLAPRSDPRLGPGAQHQRHLPPRSPPQQALRQARRRSSASSTTDAWARRRPRRRPTASLATVRPSTTWTEHCAATATRNPLAAATRHHRTTRWPAPAMVADASGCREPPSASVRSSARSAGASSTLTEPRRAPPGRYPLPARSAPPPRRPTSVICSGKQGSSPTTAAPASPLLHGEEVAGAAVARWMAQLAHRPGLDLADPLAGQVEVLTDRSQRPRLAPVEPEAQRQDLPLALIERGQQTGQRRREQRRGGDLERALRRAVLDHIAELGVAVLAQRLRQRQRLGGKAQTSR